MNPMSRMPAHLRHLLGSCVCALTLIGCSPELALESSGRALADPALDPALEIVRGDAIERHMRVLSDDALEGRGPGTRGFERGSRYVEQGFSSLGLEAVGVDGYRQPVPLQTSLVDEELSMFSVTYKGGTTSFGYGEDFTLTADPVRDDVEISAPVVFVGFGVSAPGLGYDDYADIDVDGKIVAHFTGAPSAFPNSQRAYYSSGTVKRDEAVARGAVGIISFMHRDAARSQWATGLERARRGSYAWLDPDGNPRGRGGESPILGSANLNHAAARALFAGSSVSIDEAFDRAAESRPQAFDLAVTTAMRTASSHRTLDSHNLVARLPGSDADLQDEHVVFVAHLDHLGMGVPIRGDSIYNGAHDNASGISILLEVARSFTALERAPRRSVLFLAVTAEEWGLLGSDYFAHYPTVEASNLVANISLDMPFLFHPLLDIVAYGAEHSSLDRSVGAAAERLGISIGPDPTPEEVIFIRSDHFSFIQKGVPSLFLKGGYETGDDRDGEQIATDFRRERYHTPFDEIDQGFDFDAGATHARLNFLTGYHIAMQEDRPAWNEGDFFGGLFGKNR